MRKYEIAGNQKTHRLLPTISYHPDAFPIHTQEMQCTGGERVRMRTKQVILNRTYFSRKLLFFPQQVLHLSGEQLSTFPRTLTSPHSLQHSSSLYSFHGFPAAVHSARRDAALAGRNIQPAMTEGGRFPQKPSKSENIRRCVVTGAVPFSQVTGFSQISRGPSVFVSLGPSFSHPAPSPSHRRPFSRSVPAFPLIFHRGRTGVAAAAILLPGPGAPEAAGCAATKRRCGKITGL